jgi:wyosine [tRNA(Phe)-imidazoG37] synthetase (radical SAM superfamily)
MINIFDSIAFGPVPSRRLGRSLGINNIPPKICSYSCIYCQLGRTHNLQINRKSFYAPQEIVASVKQKIQGAREKKEAIDYLTFVADGEPTLDSKLGEEIDLLKTLGIKIAVITNSSLMWEKEVRNDLSKADWVSIKIDTTDQKIWNTINRPYKSLKLSDILDGISEFSNYFTGDLVTETMLLKDVNDEAQGLRKVAKFIAEVHPKKSYLSVPIRPPAEKWVKPTSETNLNAAYQVFTKQGIDTEYLIGYEGTTFGFTGDIKGDILSISSVHPIRKDGVIELLKKADKDWSIIEKLLHEDKLIEVEYNKKKFYVRKI